MTEYTNAINLASRLIAKKGREIVIRRENKTEATNEWEKDTIDNSDYLVSGVFLGTKQKNRKGEVIEMEMEMVLVAAKDFELVPTIDDLLIDCGVVRTIVAVDPLKPGDENIMYEIGLKV